MRWETCRGPQLFAVCALPHRPALVGQQERNAHLSPYRLAEVKADDPPTDLQVEQGYDGVKWPPCRRLCDTVTGPRERRRSFDS